MPAAPQTHARKTSDLFGASIQSHRISASANANADRKETRSVSNHVEPVLCACGRMQAPGLTYSLIFAT